MTKRSLGRTRFITVYSQPSRAVRSGTQGKDLEAGTEAEALDGHCLLACLVCFLLQPSPTCLGIVLPMVG